MGTVGFSNLADAIQLHIYTVGPVPDMNLFHLFRKVATQEQVDMALGVLMDDRGVRVAQGLNEPYDEVCSDQCFVLCLLNSIVRSEMFLRSPIPCVMWFVIWISSCLSK